MGFDTAWEVIETDDVQVDLDNFVYYLLVEKCSDQAANALISDYDETIDLLATMAGSLKLLDDPEFAAEGFRKIRLRKHDYYLIYGLEGDKAVVYRMLHDLQDIDKALK